MSWEMATSFAVMCNALVGIELASTMGDEIRDPVRDLGPAIAIAGAVSIASYLLVTGAVLTLVPVERARRDSGHHAGGRRRRHMPRQSAGSSCRWQS